MERQKCETTAGNSAACSETQLFGRAHSLARAPPTNETRTRLAS